MAERRAAKLRAQKIGWAQAEKDFADKLAAEQKAAEQKTAAAKSAESFSFSILLLSVVAISPALLPSISFTSLFIFLSSGATSSAPSTLSDNLSYAIAYTRS